MRSYEAARTYFSILGFLSWCVIVFGVLVMIGSLIALEGVSRRYGGPSMAGLAGLIPGIAIVFAGFMGLVVVQIGRAGVDSAEYGQQMLKIAREQLEISRQSMRSGHTEIPSFSTKAKEQDAVAAGSPSFDDLPPPKDEPETSGAKQIEKPKAASSANVALGLEDGTLEYKGETIRVEGGKFFVDGVAFKSLEHAHKCVERNQLTAS